MKDRFLQIIGLIGATILINFLLQFVFFRIDLTTEKIFTLSQTSKNFLGKMDDDVFLTLYMGGAPNSGFSRLLRSSEEMIDEMNVYADDHIVHKTLDPSSFTKNDLKNLSSSLEAVGLAGVPVYETKEDGQKTCTIVYPYAKIESKDREIWINLLENVPGLSAEENLNRSIENLEYKIADAIRRATSTECDKIAFLEGHGELDEIDVVDVTDALQSFFQVDRGEIGDDATILDPYKAIIIAKPTKKFSEKDKFVLDQYLMRGGRILWLIDAVTITLDSLRQSVHTIGLAHDYNIEDMLFRYGVRVNAEVVEDINCGVVPISVATENGTKIVPMPWRFSPLMLTNMACPITRNVNMIKGDFVCYIDTVGENLDIRRTELLRTSTFTKTNPTPVFATLETIHQEPVRREFNRQNLCTGILEEGCFESVFSHRNIPKGVRNAEKIVEKSVETKIVVIADGDVIRNDVRFRESDNPTIVPLGYDEMTRQTFGNKSLIINALQYLTDDDGWMSLRNRTFTLRLLDKEKIGEGTTIYKVISVAIPLIFIALCGITIAIVRRKKFAFKTEEK